MTQRSAPLPRQRSREEWRNVLRRRGIRPDRSMGQNFLTDPEVVGAIVEVAGINPGDEVVEVGPGMGVLTRELLVAGAQVTAVELDRDLAAFLRDDLGDLSSFTLFEADARYFELPARMADTDWKFVANLPYSTGNVILRHMLEMASPPVTSTVMVQKEVAERMVAAAPNMSLLSLAIQIFAEGELVFEVPPDVFEPPPKVDSAVVHLVQRPAPLLNAEQREHLFKVATIAFQQKRKTLGNSLAKGLNRPKAELETELRALDIDPGLRPQAVSLDQWCVLAQSVLT